MSTDYVRSGVWPDYSKTGLNRRQILVTDHQATIITNIVAVAITSTVGPIYKLFKHPLYLLWKKISASWDPTAPVAPQDAPDQHELIEQVVETVSGERWQHIFIGTPTAANGPTGLMGYLGVAFMLVLLFGPTLALLATSIVSAGLATGKVALSLDPNCGDYDFDFDPHSYSKPFLVYERQAESEAAEYAAKCYGPTSVATDCNKFYSQNITYTKNTSANCPLDGDVCEAGKNGAVKISTGLMSGTLLGINAANPYFFGRTMTCSPMVTGKNYIREGISDRDEKQWEYWYGRSLAEYTWANPVKQSSWAIKGYSVGVHCHDPANSDNPFNPLPGFRAGSNPVTMIFISSHSLFYPEYRADPVFPAHEKAKFPPDYKGPIYYYNNSTRAGVLGCVDEYQICKTKTGPCWTNKNITSIPQAPSDRNATEEENVASLLKMALDYSTACGSIQFRQAEALDAQARVTDTQSLPLPLRQWEAEVEKMFQTSLARIQSNVYDVVRGTAAGHEGYHDIMPPNYRGICGLVEIPTLGHTNINFWGLVGTGIAVVVIWVIAWRVFLWKKILKPMANGLCTLAIWTWTQLGHLRQSKFLIGCWSLLRDYVLEPLRGIMLNCC